VGRKPRRWSPPQRRRDAGLEDGVPRRLSRGSGFPYDRRETADDNTSEWSKVIKEVQGGRRCGSAAIDLALLADGTYDGYWEKRLNPWDVAAGALLVTEAGGRVEALDGSAVPPYPEAIVATDGLVHDELLALLR